MGVISRKLFPACESMCVCCPALRSRSRQPVKRYKKLLAEIFPKLPMSSRISRIKVIVDKVIPYVSPSLDIFTGMRNMYETYKEGDTKQAQEAAALEAAEYSRQAFLESQKQTVLMEKQCDLLDKILELLEESKRKKLE